MESIPGGALSQQFRFQRDEARIPRPLVQRRERDGQEPRPPQLVLGDASPGRHACHPERDLLLCRRRCCPEALTCRSRHPGVSRKGNLPVAYDEQIKP